MPLAYGPSGPKDVRGLGSDQERTVVETCARLNVTLLSRKPRGPWEVPGPCHYPGRRAVETPRAPAGPDRGADPSHTHTCHCCGTFAIVGVGG